MRSEIPGVDHLDAHEETFFRSRNVDELTPLNTVERQVERHRCLLHSGHGSEPLYDGFVE
jgi:hypothetical protein